jgi:hypothetical protein
MDVLKLLAAAALLAPAACYEPHFPDCTVRCATSADCAPGQACGGHGYCAAPELACALAGFDAPVADGPPADSHRPPDAASKVQLRVRISEKGKVFVEDVGMCDSEGWANGDCRFSVTAGIPLVLHAIPHAGYVFERWTSSACAMAEETCMLTPIEPLTEVRARFDRDDDINSSGGE